MTLVTGGTTSTTKIGTQWYRTHIFTASTTATVDEAGAIRYLIVGGGGGGGTVMGGGGGAGGVLTGTTTLSTTGIYSIVIGAGGTGAAAGLGAIGTSGTISVWNGLFAIGGGWGASAITANPFPAGSGGSGGGASGGRESGASFGSVAGSGISGQGFAGGTSGVQWYPAGGGGAGAAGTGGGTSRGTGGLGRLDDILGAPIYWGGGGGGAGYSNYGGNGGDGGGGGGAAGNVSGGGNAFSFANRLGAGNIGGGGALNTTQNNPGGDGAPNTGGGGGGGGYLTSAVGAVNTGGFGGSGIVVLSYTIADPGPPTATGGTSYIVRQSGLFYRVHVFTQSANFDVTQGGGIEYLVVGGGGSGGARYGGGGGGGGVISGQAIISSGTYAIVVGAGAVGAQTDTVGSTGSNSTFAGVGVTAQGGGAGGGFVAGAYSAGGRGASGGGGGTLAGTASQHYSGGVRSGNNAGGGGGAAGVGADGGGTGGAGGAGLQNLILGGTIYTGLRWGAGGGGGASGAAAGAGGVGGGGGGGASSTAANAGVGGTGGFSPGQSGVSNTFGANNGGSGGANTGAGGGGGGERDTGFYTGGVGGNGGSGIVIIRYQIPTPTYTTGTGGAESLYELNPGEWYKLHTFSTNSVFTSTQDGFVQYLVVGGGGGGGTGPGGGGGAGGFQTGFLNITSGTYSIVIGQGGAGSTSTSVAGNSGTVSSFSTIVVQGGGGGASTTATTTATVGGSGAGGAGSVGPDRRLGSANIVDQGQRGGDGYFDATTSTNSAAGGGGGDATPGMKAGWQIGGRGGDGFLTVITGTNYYFAGGGGGGVSSSTAVVGLGGLGGGARGGFATTSSALSGTPGTGGGGGGGGVLTFGGDGGSGFVALAYALVATPTIAAIVGSSAVTLFAGITATITPVAGTGGIGPRSFTISPSLPSSLIFNQTNGQISGSINQIFRTNGLIQTTTYAVTVSDNVNAKATGTFTLTEIHLPEPVATGGTITTATTGTSIYRIHSFYQSGIFSINTSTAIDYIAVAGGGGGGSNMGGGGGGGGFLDGTGTVITSTATWNIIIGAGGAGGPAGSGQVAGTRGGSTAILFTGTSTLKVFSWSFDGNGDVVSTPTIIAISSGAFTLEGWVYNHRLKNNSTLWTTRPDSGTYADAYHFSWDASGVPSLNIGGVLYAAGAAGSIVAGAWQHVVCVRNSSGVVGIFVNGVRVGYQTGVTAAINRTLIGLGDFPTTPSQGLDGYISNARITSSAVYDPTLPNLTVPSQPLTAVPNVITLWCQDLAIQDNSGNLLTLTRTGDVTFSHFSPFLTLSAVGGGGGGSEFSNNNAPGTSGGSGGGVAGASNTTFGIGVPGQGNNGGASGGTYYPSGGGGSATAGSNTPGTGGAGRLNNILGPSFYWAGGGGGAGYTGNPGNGGLGGGGGGAPRQGTTAGIGDVNAVNAGTDAVAGALVASVNAAGGNGGLGTGAGGGGGSNGSATNNGGSGGGGIVAIRYRIGTIGLQVYNITTGTQYLNFYIANTGISPIGARYGYTPYIWSISPSLPLGLTFSTSTGIITGQPNESTFRSYTVTVTDANSNTGSASFSLLTNVQPNYTIDGQSDTEISFTVVNQVGFLDRSAPQINYIRIGDRTPRTVDRVGSSQRDFEIRSAGIVYAQGVGGVLEQRLYNNFGNALRKSIVVTARQTTYGFNTSTFPNITRVAIGLANTNTVNTFLSTSTNSPFITPLIVKSTNNERRGNVLVPAPTLVPNNTRNISTSLNVRTAFTVNLDYVRGHTLTNTLASSSTQIYLNVQARIVGITTVSGRTNIVGTYHQSFGTGLSRTPVRSGVNTARFTSTNIQLLAPNNPAYTVTVNPKQFYNRSITNLTTVTTTATFIFSSTNKVITYDPIRFSFKGSLAPNTYPGPGAYKSGATILIETDNAYAASSPISPNYGPITIVNVLGRGWGQPTNPLRSFSSSTLVTVPVTVRFNPVAGSTLTNNSRLLTATNLVTSIPFNVTSDPKPGSTLTNRLLSTITSVTTLVPVIVSARAGNPNYSQYSRLRGTDTLVTAVAFNITQNPVSGSTMTNTLLSRSTNRYALGVASTSQVVANLPVSITGRSIIQTQIAQSPSPLTFNINDRSYNYTILNGRVQQITNANDPTLVTVRVPVYVKGLTGQPTQVWFS